MSTYAEFLHRLEKGLKETTEAKAMEIVDGRAVSDYAAYRERVGELRAYRGLKRLIEEAQQQTEERTSK